MTLADLEAMGWEFMQTAVDEYTWVKYDKHGNEVGRQGDATWTADFRQSEADNE